MAFSERHRFLFTASMDFVIRRWDVHTGALITQISGNFFIFYKLFLFAYTHTYIKCLTTAAAISTQHSSSNLQSLPKWSCVVSYIQFEVTRFNLTSTLPLFSALPILPILSCCDIYTLLSPNSILCMCYSLVLFYLFIYMLLYYYPYIQDVRPELLTWFRNTTAVKWLLFQWMGVVKLGDWIWYSAYIYFILYFVLLL